MSHKVEVTDIVPADPKTVWDIVARGDKVNEWFSDVITSCRLEGQGEGSRRFCTLMGTDQLEETILTIDHNNRLFAYAIDAHPLPATELTADIHVSGVEGGTEITWRAKFETGTEAHRAQVEDMLTGLYTQGIGQLGAAARSEDILSRIRTGLAQSGKSPSSIGVEDLAPVDQFHIRGADGTHDVIGALEPQASNHIIDLGSGLGGPARLIASVSGAKVTGVDKNPVMTRVSNALSDWTHQSEATAFQTGDVTALPFEADHFDKAISQHVYMFVDDPVSMLKEANRVLRSGGTLVLYDPVRTDKAAIAYPVPWAASEADDHALTLDDLTGAIQAAGFKVQDTKNVSADALAWFEVSAPPSDGPPPLGLHLVTGSDFQTRIRNVRQNLASGAVELRLITARKP